MRTECPLPLVSELYGTILHVSHVHTKPPMSMHWVIGCAEHGVNKHALLTVKHTLNMLNAFTRSWTEFSCVQDGDIVTDGWWQEEHDAMCAGDFFQGVNHAGVPTAAGRFADLGDSSCKHIVLVTTSYKVREAHYQALFEMAKHGKHLVVPFYEGNGVNSCASRDRDSMDAMLYSGSAQTQWPEHTPESQDAAWGALEAAVGTQCVHCLSCRYWPPTSRTLAYHRAKHGVQGKWSSKAIWHIKLEQVVQELKARYSRGCKRHTAECDPCDDGVTKRLRPE